MVLACMWITVTGAAGVLLHIAAGLAWLSGAPPPRDILRAAGSFALLGTAAFAAGPLGVWLLRRSRPWLIATVGVVTLGLLEAVYFWT